MDFRDVLDPNPEFLAPIPSFSRVLNTGRVGNESSSDLMTFTPKTKYIVYVNRWNVS